MILQFQKFVDVASRGMSPPPTYISSSSGVAALETRVQEEREKKVTNILRKKLWSALKKIWNYWAQYKETQQITVTFFKVHNLY